MVSISIVMATYNGGKYIKEQLDSIIPYMENDDELIISDDGSTDTTICIINDYIAKNKNIQLIEGPRKGVVKNFENALFRATKEIVMFSDQDDVWFPEKLPTIRKIFESNENIELVHHDKLICSNDNIAEGGIPSLKIRSWGHGVIRNLIYSCYYGCCMAMKREFIMSIIPFSKYTIAYDQLIGLIAESHKTSYFYREPLIRRREHGGNMSQKRDLGERIKFRCKVFMSYMDTKFKM